MRSLLVCLTLALSSVVFTPPSPAAAATSNDMLYLTNQLRYAIGAPTLTADPRGVALPFDDREVVREILRAP